LALAKKRNPPDRLKAIERVVHLKSIFTGGVVVGHHLAEVPPVRPGEGRLVRLPEGLCVVGPPWTRGRILPERVFRHHLCRERSATSTAFAISSFESSPSLLVSRASRSGDFGGFGGAGCWPSPSFSLRRWRRLFLGSSGFSSSALIVSSSFSSSLSRALVARLISPAESLPSSFLSRSAVRGSTGGGPPGPPGPPGPWAESANGKAKVPQRGV
jgi:hypothetical protein